MAKVIFLSSHLGSRSEQFFSTLCTHPRIDGVRHTESYVYYEDVLRIPQQPHKRPNSSAYYLAELLFNHSFACREVLDCYKWIFLVQGPAESLNEIVRQYGSQAGLYYCYRLRGMYEYWKRTSGLLVTWGRLAGVEEYLGLREKFEWISPKFETYTGPLLAECQACFRHYFGSI